MELKKRLINTIIKSKFLQNFFVILFVVLTTFEFEFFNSLELIKEKPIGPHPAHEKYITFVNSSSC